MTHRLFALDHNFPEPVLLGLAKAIPMAELVPIRAIRSELAELDDWQLLLALHRDERPWDGLVTNDEAMLSLPKEMAVLSQTGLTLVVVRGEGHNRSWPRIRQRERTISKAPRYGARRIDVRLLPPGLAQVDLSTSGDLPSAPASIWPRRRLSNWGKLEARIRHDPVSRSLGSEPP